MTAISLTPTEVFHYTSLEAACSILATRTIWASNHRFLNDVSELEYALDILQQAAYAVRSREFQNADRGTYKYLGYLRETIAARIGDLYVASFCADPDLLSQWRGYGKPDEAYAIGLNLAKTSSSEWHWHTSVGDWEIAAKVSLLDVGYNDETSTKAFEATIREIGETVQERLSQDTFQQERSTEELLELMKTEEGQAKLAAESEISRPVWEQAYRELDDEALAALKRDVLMTKHPAFREEQEWRLVLDLEEDTARRLVRFRRSGNMMVPYIPISLYLFGDIPPISSVRVGPAAPSDAEAAMSFFLKAHDLGEVPVIRSEIPLR